MMARKKAAKALCIVMLTGILAAIGIFAGGCGEDYSTWTYAQHQETAGYDDIYGYASWEYWEKKDVTYQMSGLLGSMNCLVVANLNKDGSVVIFTAVPFDVSGAGLDWLIPVDPDATNQILNVYYGWWEKTDGAINMKYAKNNEEAFIDVPVTDTDGALKCTVSANWLTYAFDAELNGSKEIKYSTVQAMADAAMGKDA